MKEFMEPDFEIELLNVVDVITTSEDLPEEDDWLGWG